MSIFIRDTPLGICDRCKKKFPRRELSADRDVLGLIVCKDCNDVKDPWKLPWTPKDANIAVPRPRPETPLESDGLVSVVDENGAVTTAPVPTDLSVKPRSD